MSEADFSSLKIKNFNKLGRKVLRRVMLRLENEVTPNI
jgi:hypothetical protein